MVIINLGKMTSMSFIYKLFIKRGLFSNILSRRRSFILGLSLLRLTKHAYRQLRNILQHHYSCTEKAKSIHGHVAFATTIGETQCAWPCMHPSPIGSTGKTSNIGMVDFNGRKLGMVYFNGKKLNKKN